MTPEFRAFPNFLRDQLARLTPEFLHFLRGQLAQLTPDFPRARLVRALCLPDQLAHRAQSAQLVPGFPGFPADHTAQSDQSAHTDQSDQSAPSDYTGT